MSNSAMADVYVVDPSATSEFDDIRKFEEVLGLTETGSRTGSLLDDTSNMGQTLVQRREAIELAAGTGLLSSSEVNTATDLDNLTGSLTNYLKFRQ